MRNKNNNDNTDRIIIAAALAILLLAGGAFYFDGWMWGNRRGRGERIGLISNKQGDVRMKFDGDLKWQSAARGQDLIYNDAIYAGGGSQAKLALGESEMTVTENTLVVLRRQDQASFMNLSYGSLFGKLAKNEKIVIDTGDGKPIEMQSSDHAQIEVHKVRGGKTVLRVTSGMAHVTVDGKKSVIEKGTRVVVEKKHAKIEQVSLEALKPRRDQVTYSETPTRLDFAWRWSNSRQPAAVEDYKLEFSTTPDFARLHTSKMVKGQLDTSLSVNDSVSLYYRVRGPNGETSQVEKVNFVRMHRPFIVKPAKAASFTTPADQPFPVEIEFQRPGNMAVTYQIASDSEFKTVINNQTTPESKLILPMPVGQYYIRARGEVAPEHSTRWTEPLPFTVNRKIEPLQLSGGPTRDHVLIPNRDYPAALYDAAPADVRAYLAGQGLLRDFFPFSKGSFDTLKIHFAGPRGGQDVMQRTTGWPKSRLHPGRHLYKYQADKEGFTPSPWSAHRTLDISMEPPRPVGEAQYGMEKKNGERQAKWAFTPILFAKTYDVEVASDPSFVNAREIHANSPDVNMSLPAGEHYWRARARDAQGRLISEYSMPYKLAPQPVVGVPPTLARNEDRRPQAVESTTARVEPVREEPYVKNGWWAWVGAGYNYVTYRENNQGRGSVNSDFKKGPSEYGEVGFMGQNNWGGVFSYKYTPGQMRITDVQNNIPYDLQYKWTAMSAEGILRKLSPFTLLGQPIVYGLRVGIQQHRTPFLFLNSADQLDLKTVDMTDVSAGFLAEWHRRRWTYYWLMRYQYPLSSSSSGAASFDLSPIFAFDGSIGMSYNFTQQFKTGLFWYGQWHQYDFVYGDSLVTNHGLQMLFYSNIDLRFGYDF